MRPPPRQSRSCCSQAPPVPWHLRNYRYQARRYTRRRQTIFGRPPSSPFSEPNPLNPTPRPPRYAPRYPHANHPYARPWNSVPNQYAGLPWEPLVIPPILEGTPFARMIVMLVASYRRMQQMLYDHARWMEQHRARQQEMVHSQHQEMVRSRHQEMDRTRHQEMISVRYAEMHRCLRLLALSGEDSDESHHTD